MADPCSDQRIRDRLRLGRNADRAPATTATLGVMNIFVGDAGRLVDMMRWSGYSRREHEPLPASVGPLAQLFPGI